MKNCRLLRVILKAFGSALFVCLHLPTQAQNPHGILTIKTGAVLNIGKNATLVTNSDIDNRGILKNAGSIILNGNTVQAFPGTAGSISLMNLLEVKNTGAGIALNKSIKISKELKLTKGNLALGNYDVTIQSNISQTAAVSAIGTGAGVSYGSGRFVVERYVNLGSSGHAKSWQFLAVPANGQTIKDCWQEGGSVNVGYGTQVTNPLGAAAGYDLTTPNTSIKTYISATNSFDQGPSSTSSLINNAKGYMLFVRGDRTVASGTGSAPTTLRIKGTLFSPAVPPSLVTVNSGKFESVGNPYASQIDFSLLSKTGGLDNTFYTWDPTLAGFYGVGGYQTISATNSWIPVPGGGNYAGVHKTVESGQAFLVHSTSSAGTIGFAENAKTGGSIIVNKNTPQARTNNRQFIRSTLLSAVTIADGNAAVFDTDLSNEVDGDDALKIMNGAENFCLKRDNKMLAVEGRNLIASTDTLFYFMNNLRQQAYSILTVPENMDRSKEAWLVDNFLQKQTSVSLIDSSVIIFNVTSDPLSAKSDRFMLVFHSQTAVAIPVTTLRALRNVDATIALNWKTIPENNIKEYIVEKSADSIIFNAIATKNTVTNNGAEANYDITDMLPFSGNNFYRIKIASLSGVVKYSDTVKVEALKNGSEIKVYPNPAAGKLLSIYFATQVFGSYNIFLINEAGQKIWTSRLVYNNNSGSKITVQLPKNIASGKYYLSLYDKEGKSFKIALMLL